MLAAFAPPRDRATRRRRSARRDSDDDDTDGQRSNAQAACRCASASSLPRSRRSRRPAGSPTSQAHCRVICTTQGHDVRVFMPFYSSIGTAALQTRRRSMARRTSSCASAHHRYRYSLLETRLPELERAAVSGPLSGSLRSPVDLHDRAPTSICDSWSCNARHSKAVSAWSSRRTSLHCNDWHTALVPMLLQDAVRMGLAVCARRARCMSIHNIGYQGVFDASHDVRRRRRCAHLLSPETLRGRRIQLAARRCAPCRRSHDREPDLRERNLHAAGRPRPRRRAARATPTASSASSTASTTASGIRRPIATSSTTISPQDLSGKAATKRSLLDWLNLRVPATHAAARHRVAPDRAEGLRPAVRHVCPEIIATRDLSLRRARQRRGAATRVSSESCSSALPTASCSIAATTRSSRT